MKTYLLMMLAQMDTTSGQEAGMWEPIVTFLEVLVMSASTLGILFGAAIILMNPTDDEKRVTGVQTICGSLLGLAIALLAVPLFTLFDGWMFSD